MKSWMVPAGMCRVNSLDANAYTWIIHIIFGRRIPNFKRVHDSMSFQGILGPRWRGFTSRNATLLQHHMSIHIKNFGLPRKLTANAPEKEWLEKMTFLFWGRAYNWSLIRLGYPATGGMASYLIWGLVGSVLIRVP